MTRSSHLALMTGSRLAIPALIQSGFLLLTLTKCVHGCVIYDTLDMVLSLMNAYCRTDLRWLLEGISESLAYIRGCCFGSVYACLHFLFRAIELLALELYLAGSEGKVSITITTMVALGSEYVI